MSKLGVGGLSLVVRVALEVLEGDLRREIVHLDQVDDLPGSPPLLENLDKLKNVLVQKPRLLPQSFR